MGLVEGARFSGLVVLRRIGRGGMGDVYLVQNETLDRLETLKVLRGDPEPEVVTRFRAEARIGGRLRHPNIVTVYDLIDVDGQLGLRMEYVDGPDLRVGIRREGRLAPADVLAIITDVAGALDAAHRAGVLHRDVKPANVLLPEDDGHQRALLGDFGIGLLEGSARVTVPGLMGTAAYTAPERLAAGVAGAPADIYSLACTTFEALTGRPPFVAESSQALVRAHLEAPPPSPRQHVQQLPAQVDTVFWAALAKDPAKRPRTCAEFVRTLGAALAPGKAGTPEPAARSGFDADTVRALRVEPSSNGSSNGRSSHAPSPTFAAARTSRQVHGAETHGGSGMHIPAQPSGAEHTWPHPPPHLPTQVTAGPQTLFVQVSPLLVEVSPGWSDEVTVRVHNDDREPCDVEVRVHPSPGSGIEPLVKTMQVPARGFRDTTVAVHVPRSWDSRPGRHPYHVTVARHGEASPSDRCLGHVSVGVYDEIVTDLRPSMTSTRGWGHRPVNGQLVLSNRGNRPVTVDAVIRHSAGLRPVLAPVRQVVPPGKAAVHPLRLVPEEAFWLRRPVRHQFWARAVTESGAQDSTVATLVQRGRLPWWLVTSSVLSATAAALAALSGLVPGLTF